MVSITDKASKEINRIKSKEVVNTNLRLSVMGGGCSGMNYRLDFDEEVTDKDKVFEKDGLKIVIDPKSLLFIYGMEIDFSDGLDGKGFTFSNPNAKRTCGCGTSFSV